MKACLRTALLIAVAGLAGCSTPEHRIKKNPELFASFPPEVQAKVQQGEVDIGFNKDMAFIALGQPTREYTRRTADGVTEVWSYTDVYSTSERQRVSGSFRVRDNDGRLRTVNDTIWVDVDKEHEYEKLRLEFQDDVIKAIERVKR